MKFCGVNLNEYKGKRVLITGHTGFKGAWLAFVLCELGANVIGYSLESPTTPSLFNLCKLEERIISYIGDIRDYKYLSEVFIKSQPEIVFHLAAQPLVRESYLHPLETYEINVMGTVHLLECIRNTSSVESVIIVTTDKVYQNDGRKEGYIENDELNGFDPYSNSKSCADIISQSYVNSFLKDKKIPLSIMRAGNVVGGGDFAKDRLLPDCFRAVQSNDKVIIRNPSAIRPFQHVLEPIMVYLLIGLRQIEDYSVAGNYNIGPDENDVKSVTDMLMYFQTIWNTRKYGKTMPFDWLYKNDNSNMHEASVLLLNCTKVRNTFGYQPQWDTYQAVYKSIEWFECYLSGKDISHCMRNQLLSYIKGR